VSPTDEYNLRRKEVEATLLAEQRAEGRFWVKVVCLVLAVVLLLVGGCMGGMPKYRLYKADIEKRTMVSEARAKAEAAEHTARAEVTKANHEADRDRIRAQGVADSNRLISDSLTPEYIRWHYIDQLTDKDNQLIYVPTEGGIPILESNRLNNEVTP